MKGGKSRADIEDAYPLSPMQEGMLFHTLYAPNSGVYYEQIRYGIRGPVNADAMREAWQAAMNRHPILRTVFAWRNVEKPRQIVGRKVRLDWTEEKLDGEALEEMLRRNITAGFDLSRAPLIRVGLHERPGEAGEPFAELVVAFHHILLDMWSYSLIERQVFQDYRARLRGNAAVFESPRPYRDFIKGLERAHSPRAKKFWREYLRDFRGGTAPGGLVDGVAISEVPEPDALTDFGELELNLEKSESDALRAFARENRLTLNTLVSGAWALLLRRHTRENDVMFGTTVSGRPVELTGFESMTGLFINTLPLRVVTRDDEAPRDFLARLQKEQAASREYENTALARILEWCDLSEQRSIFDSIVVVENIPDSVRGEDHGLDIEYVRAFEKTNYPLTIVFHPGERFRVIIKYDRNEYDEFGVRGFLEQLTRIMKAFAGNTRRVSDIQLLAPEEHARRLAESRTRPSAPASRLLHELTSGAARAFPERIALSFQDTHWTYAELEQRANALAWELMDAGAGPDVVAGLCLERSPELILAMLAVLKAGAAYLPLDPDYPSERIAYIIDDARPPFIITDSRRESSTKHVFPSHIRVLDISTVSEEKTRNEEPPPVAVRPEHLAYIIYTSGSTGKPKGVLVPHGDAADLFASTQGWARFSEKDVWTLYHSASFDFSVWEIWGALIFGGRLVIVDYWTSRSPEEMAGLLGREGVTIFNQTPSAFRRFMEQPGQYPNLRLVIFGGEALNPTDLEPWFRAHGTRARLINMFGITETIVHVTHHEIKMDELKGTRSTIGVPLAGKRVYILDEFMNPQPIGVAGEITVGGKGMARGYLNRPDLTAERFVPDLFAPDDEAGAIMYRSGDLGRYLPDGTLEYLGRIDDQIKIRGFRIEPGEIEAALREHPHVDAAVVMARSSDGDKYLAAYFTGTAEEETARKFLIERLPEHMRPSRFTRLEALPLTQNGKVDKKALPEPSVRGVQSGKHRPPRGEIESKLAAIWSDLLKVDNPGRDDDFFRLGGDSILSIRMASRAAKEGLTFGPRDVFEQPTIGLLGDFLRRVEPPEPRHETEQADDREIEITPTPILRWFHELNLPNPSRYNMVFALKSPRRLDAKLVERTLRNLVRRHDALRLRLDETSPHDDRSRREAPRLRVMPAASTQDPPLITQELPVDRESDKPGFEFALAQIASTLQEDIRIEQGRLLSAGLVRAKQSEHDRLIIAVHHIASDGVSWRILLEEFQEIYEFLEEGKSPEAASRPLSFAAWANRKSSTSWSASERQKQYWLTQ